jgi:hydrogenase-4 component B
MDRILLITIAFGIFASVASLALYKFARVSKYSFFVLLGISSIGAIWSGITALITQQHINYQIKTGFPNLSLYLTIDPLSGFFLALIGIIVISVAIYGPSYTQYLENHNEKNSFSILPVFTGLFVTSMYLVVLAHDIFSFMLAWELMSISSYFLVAYHHEQPSNRHAAIIYLLMAQTSGLLILFAFSILAKFGTSLNFVDLHLTDIPLIWKNFAFFLAFLGFGMKAGIVPLHVWLPLAHPVAPSHISALMSGVMLKIAIYGFIRFVFDLLGGNVDWLCGAVVLFIGVISALFGVLYALMQHNLKKLLAYHSVENIGIIFIALGLSLIFKTAGHPILAALGLIAALYHCLNHAIFKSLLFLGAGTIINSCQENDLEKMGGLMKKMPYTSWFFLIGCVSISGLPPFNGFVSEWLIFQDAFQAISLTSEIMRTLIPIAAAILALTTALAAACFVKVYGVAFLGQARSNNIAKAHDPKTSMLLALGFLAMLCIFFGILPTITINILNNISTQLIGAQLLPTQNWLWLIPITIKTSSYNAIFITIGLIITALICLLLARIFFGKNKIRYAEPWDCGFGGINQRMQYTATAFSMPIRQTFKALGSNDWSWQNIYLPLERIVFTITKKLAKLQGGNIRIYLAYTFITLVLLLLVIT